MSFNSKFFPSNLKWNNTFCFFLTIFFNYCIKHFLVTINKFFLNEKNILCQGLYWLSSTQSPDIKVTKSKLIRPSKPNEKSIKWNYLRKTRLHVQTSRSLLRNKQDGNDGWNSAKCKNRSAFRVQEQLTLRILVLDATSPSRIYEQRRPDFQTFLIFRKIFCVIHICIKVNSKLRQSIFFLREFNFSTWKMLYI